MSGKAVDDPAFPKLDPLPDVLAKQYLERTAHMSKLSQQYNCMFSIGKVVCLFMDVYRSYIMSLLCCSL